MEVGAPEASTRENVKPEAGIDVCGCELTCEVEGVTGGIGSAFRTERSVV